MIYYTECPECGTVVRVLGDPATVEIRLSLFKGSFPCVNPGCSGTAQRRNIEEVVGKEHHSIPLDTYFRGLHNLGMTVEPPAPVELVKSMLLGSKIRDVVVEPVGQPERTLIWKIELENGAILHLAPSGKGPCVYRVESPGKGIYDDEINNLHLEGTVNEQCENREEAG